MSRRGPVKADRKELLMIAALIATTIIQVVASWWVVAHL
jgi:hypothetical protein